MPKSEIKKDLRQALKNFSKDNDFNYNFQGFLKYPLTSLIISLLFWIIILGFFGWFFLSDHKEVKSVNIEANLVQNIEKSNSRNQLENKQNQPQKPLIKKEKGKTVKQKIKKVQAQKLQNQDSDSNQNQSAKPIWQPLPQIPEELRAEAFQSYAIARFHINFDGSFTVELIKPCDNLKLNFLLLNSLKKWQFQPEKKLGVLVPSTKDIRVEFRVE